MKTYKSKYYNAFPVMIDLSHTENQIHRVSNFQDLISTPFHGEMNALCWTRKLIGDFSEIVKKLEMNETMAEIDQKELLELQLSEHFFDLHY